MPLNRAPKAADWSEIEKEITAAENAAAVNTAAENAAADAVAVATENAVSNDMEMTNGTAPPMMS
jgi:hypothetical protein